MALTTEQQKRVDSAYPIRVHRGQKLWQAINFETQSFLWVHELDGLGPLPAEADVARALWARAHVPDAGFLSLTDVQQDLVEGTLVPVAADDQELWEVVNKTVNDIVSTCETRRWLPVPCAADLAEVLWERAHDSEAVADLTSLTR